MREIEKDRDCDRDLTSEISFSLDFEVRTVLSANDSILWKTPSRQNVGLYNRGIFANSRSVDKLQSSNNKGGRSLVDKKEDAKLATSTN
jgi:hypothetical protein